MANLNEGPALQIMSQQNRQRYTYRCNICSEVMSEDAGKHLVLTHGFTVTQAQSHTRWARDDWKRTTGHD